MTKVTAPDNFNPRIPRGMRLPPGDPPDPTTGFQSTHPARDATVHQRPYHLHEVGFQSTHPARDATLAGKRYQHAHSHFNPRIPRGMRPAVTSDKSATRPISIHASREGCDLNIPDAEGDYREFQSTHPARDATSRCSIGKIDRLHFNPRIPRGMRRVISPDSRLQRPISIHASREGCDDSHNGQHSRSGYFNPRIPRGMRPGLLVTLRIQPKISIHASREGCDQKKAMSCRS